MAIDMAILGRLYKRHADHLARQVVYIVTGRFVGETAVLVAYHPRKLMSRGRTSRRFSAPTVDDEGLVHIAVPAAFLGPVTRLIEELHERQRPAETRRPEPAVAQHHDSLWPVEELRRFACGRTKTHITIRTIMDLLAQRHGELLMVSEIAAALDMSRNQVVGALAGLTRVVKAQHDFESLGIPVSRLREPAGDREEVRLGLNVEQARRWTLVRTSVSP